MVFSWLFRGPHLPGKTVFGPFSWLFRGPRFGQILRVLALEKSSDLGALERILFGNFGMEFGEGNATKQKSIMKKASSLNEGKALSE